MFEVSEEILVYAFRYTLGRQTGAPYDIATLLIQNKNKLNEYTKAMIVKEIEWFLDKNKDHPSDLIELWNNVMKELSNR